eukprot:28861_1
MRSQHNTKLLQSFLIQIRQFLTVNLVFKKRRRILCIFTISQTTNPCLRYSQIRKWFAATEALQDIPRFFCIDACRVIENDSQNDLVTRSRAPANASGTNSTTITGTTEGNTVR